MFEQIPGSYRSLLARQSLLLAMLWLSGILITGQVNAANANSTPQNAGVTDKRFDVDYHEGRLSVSAKKVVLTELMLSVGAATGIKIIAYGDLSGQTGSWSFSDLPLSVAIKKLLRNTNAIVTYSSTGNSDQEPVISAIHMLATSSSNSSLLRIDTVEPNTDQQLPVEQAQEQEQAAEPSLGDFAYSLQHDPDPGVRKRSVTALEQIGDSAALNALEAGMDDGDPSVRMQVAQSLGRINDERSSLLLGQIIMGDPNAEVRLEALRAIASKKDPAARTFLEAATGDSSSEVSDMALRLLQ